MLSPQVWTDALAVTKDKFNADAGTAVGLVMHRFWMIDRRKLAKLDGSEGFFASVNATGQGRAIGLFYASTGA